MGVREKTMASLGAFVRPLFVTAAFMGCVLAPSTWAAAFPPPTITGVSPASGPTEGGTQVQVIGSGFVAGSVVSFGATAAQMTSMIDAATLTCTAPVGTAGTVDVTVTNPDGQKAVKAAAFSFFNTLPVISSSTDVTTTLNTPFSYSITASGSQPIQYSATGLPPGVFQSGAFISGTPSMSGTYSATISATNPGGTVNTTLLITVAAATLWVSESAFPAPSATILLPANAPQSDPVLFSGPTTDTSGMPVTVTWSFGDGTMGTGAQAKHSYTAEGAYQVLASMSDGTERQMTVIVEKLVDLGVFHLSVNRGRLSMHLPAPTSFAKNDRVKSMMISGSAGSFIKFRNSKLSGVLEKGNFSFTVEFNSAKRHIVIRRVYKFSVVN